MVRLCSGAKVVVVFTVGAIDLRQLKDGGLILGVRVEERIRVLARD